jgi:type VI secretion system secreted protein Hcp
MAQEIYLRLDGIPGESNKKGVEGWIEIFSFSNGSTNHSSVAAGTGSGAGKVEFSSISVTKQLDLSSTKLALVNWKGTHIATGTIQVRQSTGDATTKAYYQYDMKEVFVDSISWGAAGGGAAKPSESVSFSFNEIKLGYSQQNPDGSLAGMVFVGWNTQSNASV